MSDAFEFRGSNRGPSSLGQSRGKGDGGNICLKQIFPPSPLHVHVPVYGYIYDVRSGRLDEVPAATEADKAQ